MIRKLDSSTPCFTKVSAGAISIKAGTQVFVAGRLITFAAATAATIDTGALAAGSDYALYVTAGGLVIYSLNFTAPMGYNATSVARIGGFHYAPGGNAVAIAKTAVATGTAIGAQTVTADRWALYRLSVIADGTITVTPAADNVAGYASEAAAIAALPALPALSVPLGHVTVKTASGLAWIAATDALKSGASGNPASETNYYPNAAAIGCALSRGTTDTNIASTAFNFFLGGDSTPAINEYSIWDEKFRPACADPRGMALVAGGFWADIYLAGTNPDVDGTSKYGATIADGSSPAKVPALFGGNGTIAQIVFDWYCALIVGMSVGKQLLSQPEIIAATTGTTEYTNVTGSGDPGTTQLDANHTSKWGLMQATGNMWIWGLPCPSAASAPFFGGTWYAGAVCGSRGISWGYAPSFSSGSGGARFRCDHLLLP